MGRKRVGEGNERREMGAAADAVAKSPFARVPFCLGIVSEIRRFFEDERPSRMTRRRGPVGSTMRSNTISLARAISARFSCFEAR